MVEKIEIEGLKELEQQLVKLGGKVGVSALRKGLLQASTPMFQAAKAKALQIRDSGATHAALRRRGSTNKRFNQVNVYIEPNGKSKRAISLYQKDHNLEKPPLRLTHFHMIEKGTKRSKPQPFLRPAFDQTAKQVLARFKDDVQEQIKKVTIK